MRRSRLSREPVCENCGSTSVCWDPEIDEFICTKCDHHLDCEDLVEEIKYKLDLVDFQLTEIPDWVFTKTYLKEIDLSAEPSDSFHYPFINRISVPQQ